MISQLWVLSNIVDKNLTKAGTNRFNSVMILVIEEKIKITIFPNIFFFSFFGPKDSAVFEFFWL